MTYLCSMDRTGKKPCCSLPRASAFRRHFAAYCIKCRLVPQPRWARAFVSSRIPATESCHQHMYCPTSSVLTLLPHGASRGALVFNSGGLLLLLLPRSPGRCKLPAKHLENHSWEAQRDSTAACCIHRCMVMPIRAYSCQGVQVLTCSTAPSGRMILMPATRRAMFISMFSMHGP